MKEWQVRIEYTIAEEGSYDIFKSHSFIDVRARTIEEAINKAIKKEDVYTRKIYKDDE